jgi:hypothetical protein
VRTPRASRGSAVPKAKSETTKKPQAGAGGRAQFDVYDSLSLNARRRRPSIWQY